jgi:hypothetical protein
MCDWRMAVHYRNRSRLLRTIADEPEHDHDKAALRNVADYYDTVAEAIEREVKDKDG